LYLCEESFFCGHYWLLFAQHFICLHDGNKKLPIEEIELPKSANPAKLKIPRTKMRGICKKMGLKCSSFG